jgi:hypothetical protein
MEARSRRPGEVITVTEDLKIRQKIEDMMAYAYPALAQFPKAEKHALAAEIKSSMRRLLELTIICNKKYFKKMIYDSYACRNNKGSHRAADRTQQYLREAVEK